MKMLEIFKKKEDKEGYEYFFAGECVKIVSEEVLKRFVEDDLIKRAIYIKEPSGEYLELDKFIELYLVFKSVDGKIVNEKGNLVQDIVDYICRNEFPDFLIKLMIQKQHILQQKRFELDEKIMELKRKLFIVKNGKTE